jgi:hypothetical protein
VKQFHEQIANQTRVLTANLTANETDFGGQPRIHVELAPPLTSTDVQRGTSLDCSDVIGNRVWGNSPWVQIPPSPPVRAGQKPAAGFSVARLSLVPLAQGQVWEPRGGPVTVRSRESAGAERIYGYRGDELIGSDASE